MGSEDCTGKRAIADEAERRKKYERAELLGGGGSARHKAVGKATLETDHRAASEKKRRVANAIARNLGFPPLHTADAPLRRPTG